MAIFSIILPLVGIAITIAGVANTRKMADYGRSAVIAYFIWSGMSLLGILCSICSIRRHNWRPSAVIGLVLGTIPFVLGAYFIISNAK